jgi:hypothetical protein
VEPLGKVVDPFGFDAVVGGFLAEFLDVGARKRVGLLIMVDALLITIGLIMIDGGI